MAATETTVLDELDDRINEILSLSNENKKQEAFTKLEKLNQDISAVGSRGRSERNMALIRGEMMAKQKVNRKLASLKAWAAAREAQQQEEVDCLIVGNSVSGDTSGVSDQYLERNSNGIVIGFEGSNKNRTCLNRDVLTPDNLRNALVEVCTYDGMPNGDVYVNMRKLGVITDAIVPLEEIFTVIIAKDKKRFNLHKKLDEDGDHEQVLIISYGVAGTFRGKPDSVMAEEIYLTNQKLMEDYGLSEEELPIADPELISPSLENFIEVSNAVSAAHCEKGDEKSIYELKPVTPFENKELLAEGYNRLVSSGFVRAVTQYPIDSDKLDQLSRETMNLLQVYEPSAPQIQQYFNEDEDQETEDMKALINCALANYFKKNGAFEEYTADRFDNRTLTPEQNYELKLKAIFGEEWVNSRIPAAERGGWAEDKITSEKLRQLTIDYINREDNNQPDSVKRMELDWVVSAPAAVYNIIIEDLKEEIQSKIKTLEDLTRNLKLMDTIEVFDDHMEKMVDRYCSPEDAEDIARGLFSDSQVSSTERIINCAFGEYYRTGGTFDQKEQNNGVSVDPKVLNEMKVTHIYSKHWFDVVTGGGDDECTDEEKVQTPDKCIYITPEILKDIAKKYVEKRFRERKISEEERQQLKDDIRSFGLENTKRELSDLKGELYDRIQDGMSEYREENDPNFLNSSASDYNRWWLTDIHKAKLINICGNEISLFSNELVRNNCDRPRTPTEVARRLSFGEEDEDDNISSAETASVHDDDGDDHDDQYQNLIYCAFGKWYGENGNFEQLLKDEAAGNGEQEPTSNDITNEKMEDFFSKEWIGVLLDRSADSVHGGVEIQEVLAGLEQPPFLNESKLISITESYIRDNTESESKKTELLTGLSEYSNMQEDPVEEILLSIQDKLYKKINETANETSEEVSYWDNHNGELLDICKTEIHGFTAELVRNYCNSSLFQVESQDSQASEGEDSFSQVARAVANNQVNTRRGNSNQNIDSPFGNDPLLTPISSIYEGDYPDDGGPMSPSDFEGGKKKKRRKSKKGKKTKKKKAKKNKKRKKTKRRVKFNLKNNEYYTITPKNKIRRNKKRGTRKKKH